MSWSNNDAVHRHACHAHEDFRALRRDRDNEDLWHSMSHHLRHVVHRSSHEVKQPRVTAVRRANVHRSHK
jgi:DNA-binding GntR family transcriptional regulator